MRTRYFFLVLSLFVMTGCMSIATKAISKTENSQAFGIPYSGVMTDVQCLGMGMGEAIFLVPFFAIDTPLSAIMDTIFYPLDKIYEFDGPFDDSGIHISKGTFAVICPSELKATLPKNGNSAETTKFLIKSKYEIVIVTKEMGGIIPVQHYKQDPTFNETLRPMEVTFEKPMHISTLAIFDNSKEKYGVAIKERDNVNWKVYWLKKNELSKSLDYIYLPPLKKLEILNIEKIH